MDRARYLAEIASDAKSIVADATIEPCDLSRNSSFNLADSEIDAIDVIADNTVSSGNWAEYTLIHSRNVDACDDLGEIPDTARKAICHIAFYAYRADLIDAVSAFSNDEIAEICGWHQCEECDEWHDVADEAARCCGEDDDEPDDDEGDEE